MQDSTNPRQLILFPEISEHSSLPSITTLPEFDHALNNLIRISDLGAFIQLNIQGLDKVYSINLRDLSIPPDFLSEKPDSLTPLTIYLFPDDIRKQMKKFTYEIKSFFNPNNSFKTSFGYFLYRSHFILWRHYLDEMKKSIEDYAYHKLGGGKYGKVFIDGFQQGYHYLQEITSDTAPWTFRDSLTMKELADRRGILTEKHETANSLKPSDEEYPLDLVLFRSAHIPTNLRDYVNHIQISAIFKSIHLEYLADKTIKTVDDIKNLVKEI